MTGPRPPLRTRRSRSARTSVAALAAGLITLATAGVLASREQPAPAEARPAPPPVQVATVVRRDVTDWDTFTGRFEATERVELRPRVSGYVASVSFDEGSLVEKGQVLFRIDPRPYQAALDGARAELAEAKARRHLASTELQRAAELLESRVIPREEYDRRQSRQQEATARLAAARAAVAAAELDVEFTAVPAPIAGRISRAEVTAGNYVTAGNTRLTTIVSVDPIFVYFEGDERSFLKYAAQPAQSAGGRIVRVGLAGESGFPHDGRLDFIDNALDPATGTIRVRAALANPGGRFTPGLFARVQVMGGARDAAILVDPRAVGTDQDRRFVYVVDADGTLSYRSVRVDEMVEGLRIVQDGLVPGERVVVGSLAMLRPGMAVAPRHVAPDGPDDAVIAMNGG